MVVVSVSMSPNVTLQYSYLGDTLLVLSTEKDSPCNATWVLALEEEGFGLSVLESENLAVSTDVELSLLNNFCQHPIPIFHIFPRVSSSFNLSRSRRWRSV